MQGCANAAVAQLFGAELDLSLLTLIYTLGLGAWVPCTAGEGFLWMKQLGQEGRSLAFGSEL